MKNSNLWWLYRQYAPSVAIAKLISFIEKVVSCHGGTWDMMKNNMYSSGVEVKRGVILRNIGSGGLIPGLNYETLAFLYGQGGSINHDMLLLTLSMVIYIEDDTYSYSLTG